MPQIFANSGYWSRRYRVWFESRKCPFNLFSKSFWQSLQPSVRTDIIRGTRKSKKWHKISQLRKLTNHSMACQIFGPDPTWPSLRTTFHHFKLIYPQVQRKALTAENTLFWPFWICWVKSRQKVWYNCQYFCGLGSSQTWQRRTNFEPKDGWISGQHKSCHFASNNWTLHRLWTCFGRERIICVRKSKPNRYWKD